VTDHRGRIIQDGHTVALVMAATRESMLANIGHYAAVYSQDGPIKIETRTGKSRWKEHKP